MSVLFTYSISASGQCVCSQVFVYFFGCQSCCVGYKKNKCIRYRETGLANPVAIQCAFIYYFLELLWFTYIFLVFSV